MYSSEIGAAACQNYFKLNSYTEQEVGQSLKFAHFDSDSVITPVIKPAVIHVILTWVLLLGYQSVDEIS